MGLPITKKLVDLMHGKIGFESQPGSGSRFWIELDSPIARSKKTQSEISPYPSLPALILFAPHSMSGKCTQTVLQRFTASLRVFKEETVLIDELNRTEESTHASFQLWIDVPVSWEHAAACSQLTGTSIHSWKDACVLSSVRFNSSMRTVSSLKTRREAVNR